jgi:hypothetical protein
VPSLSLIRLFLSLCLIAVCVLSGSVAHVWVRSGYGAPGGGCVRVGKRGVPVCLVFSGEPMGSSRKRVAIPDELRLFRRRSRCGLSSPGRAELASQLASPFRAKPGCFPAFVWLYRPLRQCWNAGDMRKKGAPPLKPQVTPPLEQGAKATRREPDTAGGALPVLLLSTPGNRGIETSLVLCFILM